MSTLDKAFIRAYTKHPEGSSAGDASEVPARSSANAETLETGPLETVAVTFADGVWHRVDRPAPAANTAPAPHLIMPRKPGQRPVGGSHVKHREASAGMSAGENIDPPQAAPDICSATFALTAAMESVVRGWQTETQVVALPSEEKASSPPIAAHEQKTPPDAAPEHEFSSRWAEPYFGVVEMLADQNRSPGAAVYEDWELPAPAAAELADQSPPAKPVLEPCFQWTDTARRDAGFPHDLFASMVVAADEPDASTATETLADPTSACAPPPIPKAAEKVVGKPAEQKDAQEEIAPEEAECEPKVGQENVVASETVAREVVEAEPPAIAPAEEAKVGESVVEQPTAPSPPHVEQSAAEQVEEIRVTEQPIPEKPVAEESGAAEVKTSPPSPKVFAPSWEVDHFKWPAIVDKLVGEEHDQLELVAIRLLEEARDGKNLLAVTGGVRGEGRTTLTLSLARLASQLGHTVAIVDADFAHHEIGPQLGLDIPQGWECVVSQSLRLEEVAVVSLSDRLTAFPLGSATANPSLDSERVSAVLQQLAAAFDLVLVDLGPVEAGAGQTNEAEKAGLAARAILVQDARRPDESRLQDIVRRLDSLGIEALGVVETFRPAA